jgi:hypothetical protein
MNGHTVFTENPAAKAKAKTAQISGVAASQNVIVLYPCRN